MSNHELYWRLGDSRWVWGHDLKRLYDDEERDVVREVLSRQHWNHSPMDFAVGGDAERLQWATGAIAQDTDPVDVRRRRPEPELPTELPMIVWQAANQLVDQVIHLRWRLGCQGSILAEVNRNDLVAELLRLNPGIGCEAASRQSGLSDQVESAPPALTANQLLVLQTMALFDASLLVTAEAIAAEMNMAERLSERSIGPIVRKLIEVGLAERPEGDRSGARLTTAGRRLAQKIAD